MSSKKNRACPACRAMGHDKTGDHLWQMRSGRWACHKREHHENGENYYEDDEGSAEPMEDLETRFNNLKSSVSRAGSIPSGHTASFTLGSPSVEEEPVYVVPIGVKRYIAAKAIDPDAEYRSIRADVYKKYGVKYQYDGKDLLFLAHNLYDTDGNVVVEKIRQIPKDFFTTGKTKGVALQLFGQSVFPRAKRLLITEGELDALSAYQMLEKYRVACVSLPTGANIKALADNMEYLRGFKEIYVCVDNDDAGKKVSRDIVGLLPNAKFLKISEKDANDMLTKGKHAEFISAFFDAELYQPDTIIRVGDIMDAVMKPPVMGTPWPWPSLTAATYGRRGGEGMYVGAGVKIGKSEFINQLVSFDIQEGRKIAVLKYEEPPHITVKRVAGKMDHIFYHKPGVVYNPDDLKRRALSMHPYLYMYPAFGKATWDSTREFLAYARVNGCETLVIDPVTKLTNSMDSSSTEEQLRKLSDDLACMAHDMGFFYIVTCHLKAPVTGLPHERGGRVNSNQFRGSRAMMENCYYMLGIERNKDPELPQDERNTSKFVLLEDRNFGNSVSFPVFYDVTTQSYLEPARRF